MKSLFDAFTTLRTSKSLFSPKFLSLSILFISTYLFTSCGLAQTRPKLEMSLAQSAFRAAKEAEAFEHTPNLYRQAEIYYLRAASAYKRKYFNKAKEYAIVSRKYSEKAEYNTRRKLVLGNE